MHNKEKSGGKTSRQSRMNEKNPQGTYGDVLMKKNQRKKMLGRD
jgi:hypothetical protein